MRIDADVAVVGSGFAGSLVALALRRRGRRVVLVERGSHPRFAIGESSTPLANLLLEEIADRYDLPQIRVFSKWGTWQRARPDVAGGLKRGFTFYFHRPGEPFADDEAHARQLMVAASPHDDVGDTHWYRADFDRNLVQEAESAGAVYLDRTAVDRIDVGDDRVSLDGVRDGASVHIDAAFLVDASGPRGLLSRALNLDASSLRWMPPTEGIYTHFENVAPSVGAIDMPYVGRPETQRVGRPFQGRQPPYPPDAAAVHHVFPGGWIWMLRFNNGITSAGAAMIERHGRSVRRQPDHVWRSLLDTLPSVREQFANARAAEPWIHTPRLAFRTTGVAGPSWALLPSAAGVIDPLLSTGIPLTLLGVQRLLEMFDAGVTADALREYERVTLEELDATEHLVAALYASMADVPMFKRLTLLYFAAASFSEAARRLGRPELAPGFLLHAHPRFGPELRACCDLALASPQGSTRDELFARVDRAIEPFDVAGLLDRSRLDWYPVLADDLLASASKLEASRAEIDGLLERSGFSTQV